MTSGTETAAPPAKTPTKGRPITRERKTRARKQNLWIYAFLMPTFILYGLYTIYPIIASYWYSLVEWNGFNDEQKFVGLSNYEAVLADPLFWSSLRVTLVFMLIMAPLRVFGAFFLAILLNSRRLPFAKFFRTVYFIPVVTTTAIVGVVMRFILDPASGPVAAVMRLLDLGPVDLLGNSGTALATASLIYVWKFFGITLIYWMAALQTIPEELFEAARIDGAGPIKMFRYITLPMLLPFLLIISVLTIEDAFHAFDLMQAMTAGGPFFSTEVIEIYIYRWAFAASIPQLGFASAAAVLFGLIVLVAVALQILAIIASRRMQKEQI